MTILADPDGDAATRIVEGRLYGIDDRIFVCRCPVSTSLPIPLAVTAPDGIELLTWAFGGLDPDDPDDAEPVPHCLLVLAADDASALRAGGRVTLALHVHDLAVAFPSIAPAADLPRRDRDLLCRAVLSALAPDTIGPLSALFPLLAASMTALPVAKDAPDLTIATDGATHASLTGYAVPSYLLLAAGEAMVCARVASATVRPGTAAAAELTLEPLRGRPSGRAPDVAILIENGGFTPARLAASAA